MVTSTCFSETSALPHPQPPFFFQKRLVVYGYVYVLCAVDTSASRAIYVLRLYRLNLPRCYEREGNAVCFLNLLPPFSSSSFPPPTLSLPSFSGFSSLSFVADQTDTAVMLSQRLRWDINR